MRYRDGCCLRGEIKPGQDRQIEAIAATCGLIHDLGNPPFGHAGEDAIREWFMSLPERPQLLKEFLGEEQLETDFSKFKGNAQTLRIVSKLQVLADFNGLNLTFGTLSAAIKYVSPSHEADESHGNHARTKVGYFASENDLVARIRVLQQIRVNHAIQSRSWSRRQTISFTQSQISRTGIKKGILLWRDFEEEFKTSCDSGKVKSILERKDRILKGDTGVIRAGLPDDTHGSAFRTAAIAEFVNDSIEVFKERYSEIMVGRYQGELIKNSQSRGIIDFYFQKRNRTKSDIQHPRNA